MIRTSMHTHVDASGWLSFQESASTHLFPQVTEIVSTSLILATLVYGVYMYMYVFSVVKSVVLRAFIYVQVHTCTHVCVYVHWLLMSICRVCLSVLLVPPTVCFSPLDLCSVVFSLPVISNSKLCLM